MAQDLLQTFARALACHFHEAELRDRRNTGTRRIALQRFDQGAQHLAPMFFIDHVDEVDDDDAADVAHFELPGD